MRKNASFIFYFCLTIFCLNSCTTLPSLPYNENFSASNGTFTFVNGTQANKWFYGSAAGNLPNAIYITNTTNGSTNNYNTGVASTAHTYKDITIPAGTSICNLSFDWKATGESSFDYLRVWLVPASFSPAAGTQITAGAGRLQVAGDFNQQNIWQTYVNNNIDLSSFAGGTLRIVFEWRNNASGGNQSPAAIDNISISTCRVPSAMSATVTSPNTATLSWTPPTPATGIGYEYYYTTTNVPPTAATTATGSSNTSPVDVSALVSNTTYYWWIRSVCAANSKSIWVSGPSFITPKCNTTTPIVSVTNITHNSASLSWPKNNGAASYVVRYRPLNTSSWISTNVPVTPPPSTVNTFDLPPNLLPETLYEIEVSALCDGSSGNYSHNEFTTRCNPAAPNVVISNITSATALVTWSPLSSSATYELQWREVGTIPWNTPAIPQPPANSFTITGLTSNKIYEVQVRSTCIGNTVANPWSNIKVFTTVRDCQIAPPGLTITALTPTSAEVVWDAFPGATYILRYRKVGIPGWINIPVNTNTFTITGLLELTKYELQVANVCNGTVNNYTPLYYFTTPTIVYCQMSSGNSTEFISKVTANPTGKPEMINETGASNYSDFTDNPQKHIEMIQGSTGNQITIDKKLSSGTAAGVSVWIDFNRNGTFDLNERILADGPNTNSTAKAIFNVPADAFISMTDYKFVRMRVAVQKDAIPVNCSNFAIGEVEDYTVKISKPVVINPLNQDEILIYPNPVKSVLNVKNISKKANYKIYSISGQMISNGIILNNKIDVSKLVNGIFIIDIQDVNGNVKRKFIKE